MDGFPDYKRPPVIEVAASVQFKPLKDLSAPHTGLYWNLIRNDFARIEEQAPIARLFEPPVGGGSVAAPRVEFSSAPDLPRTWFLNSKGDRLIQIQRDRFAYNWKRVDPEDEYPRYKNVKPSFVSHWEEFCDFLAREGIASPEVEQLELTYVNQMRTGDGWQSMKDLGHLFTDFDWKRRSGFLPEPETVGWSMHFLLPNNQGRLHANMSSVVLREDRSRAIHLTLLARGMPSGTLDQEAMARWFDLAHEWIVKGFADLVAEETDILWGKKVCQ